MRTTSPKDPGETIQIPFNFAPDLLPGETLTGTPTTQISQIVGLPDPTVGSMFVGAAQLSGSYVIQTCTLGQAASNYAVTATCSTSTGRILVEGGVLPVVWAYLQ